MRSKFLQLINQQQLFQKNNSLLKINIHIAIRGAIKNHCLNVNQLIQAETKSLIDFSENSYHKPHLTLNMGYVRKESDLKNIFIQLDKLSKNINPFLLKSKRVYIVEPENKFVFIDSNNIEKLMSLKKEVHLLTKKYLLPLSWDVLSAKPHITVAYITKDIKKIRRILISKSEEIKWPVEAIEISICGLKGSCLGTLKSFEVIS
jgi:2'-5' RNA ligase